MNTEQYLSVSSLAYSDLNKYKGWRIGELYSAAGPIDSEFMEKLENNQLRSLSHWTLINTQTTPSGMSAIAVQNP